MSPCWFAKSRGGGVNAAAFTPLGFGTAEDDDDNFCVAFVVADDSVLLLVDLILLNSVLIASMTEYMHGPDPLSTHSNAAATATSKHVAIISLSLLLLLPPLLLLLSI